MYADLLRRTYEKAMGVPSPADWANLSPDYQEAWAAVARVANLEVESSLAVAIRELTEAIKSVHRPILIVEEP